MFPTVTRAQLSSHHTEPKTILGFFLAFFVVVMTGAVAIVAALVWKGHGRLAAAVLVAVFVIGVGILIWVARTQRKDPTALMLGQVTAGDYLAIQRWTAGDSSRGERRARVPSPAALADVSVAALPAGVVEEAEEVVVQGADSAAPDSDQLEVGESDVVDQPEIPGEDGKKTGEPEEQ